MIVQEEEGKGFVPHKPMTSIEKWMAFSALGFMAASALLLAYGIYIIIVYTGARSTWVDEFQFGQIIARNFDVVSIFVFAISAAWIGLRLFAKAGQSANYVIRPEDQEFIWPLIAEPKPDAIDQYIRLASLSGMSGTFTKIGFTGLPLATVALTLVFVGLALFNLSNKEVATTLFDMSKLTLGAFIGSFVQKQVQGREEVPSNGGTTQRERGLPA
ncbi:MAG: hypothetical protein LCH38_08100 [Proteobacteria bacterium]|nr:hypothetical protein [Pseudomonadota bacterium]